MCILSIVVHWDVDLKLRALINQIDQRNATLLHAAHHRFPTFLKTFQNHNSFREWCALFRSIIIACYVGQTGRHIQTRLKEHLQRAGPMKSHLAQYNATLTSDQVDIIHYTSRGESFLLTLEALHIRERKPSFNTKDEYKSKELVIKL